MKKVYTSINLGSDTIKFVVGELYNNKINLLSSYEITSKGIRKGLIVDANLVINSIKDGIKEINKNLGIGIKKVIVNVPSYNAKFLYVTSSITNENEDKIITSKMVANLIKKSVYSKLANDYELLTVIPLDFVIDGNKGNNKAVGIKGTEIEFKGIMISTPKKNIYSVISCIEGASLEVADITFDGIGDYFEVRNANLDKKVGAIINLGHDTTTVSIINKGKFMNTEIIQIGGRSIDKDLACVFGISIFDARTIKEKFAVAHKRYAQIGETYEVKNNLGEMIKLNQYEVSQVTMERLIELLNLAKKQILLLTKQNINYIVFTGGLTEIKNFRNLCYEIFGKDVIIYSMNTLGIRDNKYTTSLGMIKYFIDKMEVRGKEISLISEEDEVSLITPKNNHRKIEGKIITNLFTKFLSNNKEEKND